jgi:hypothetical protein
VHDNAVTVGEGAVVALGSGCGCVVGHEGPPGLILGSQHPAIFINNVNELS